MSFHETFIKQLEAVPASDLPGFSAQKKMGPRLPDGSHPHAQQPTVHCRQNGVMILLYPHANRDDFKLVLTVRSDEMPSHKGQISFPGGGIRPDETPVEAALRETEEETGIPAGKIRIVGTLSDLYIPVSGNILKPVVGFYPEKPVFRPDHNEVSKILTPGLSELLDPANKKTETWKIRDFELIVPFWDIFETPLWGATAMVLSEFLEVIPRKN